MNSNNCSDVLISGRKESKKSQNFPKHVYFSPILNGKCYYGLRSILPGQQYQGHEYTCPAYQGPPKVLGGQAQGPKGHQPQAPSTCLHCPVQAQETCSYPHCQGSQALPAKGQGQGSNQGPGWGCSSSCSSNSSTSSQRHPRHLQSGGLCLPLWGWKDWGEPENCCPSVLFVQVSMRQGKN